MAPRRRRSRGQHARHQAAIPRGAVVPWQGQGSLNRNPRPRRLNAAQRDQERIDFLRSKGVHESELQPVYVTPPRMNNQGLAVNEKNGRACAIFTRMGRNRRLYLWSWIVRGDTNQAVGDRKGIIRMLAADAAAANALAKAIIYEDGGVPVKMPKVFNSDPDYTYLRR